MMYVRFQLSLRNGENLLFERGIDLRHETARMWWNRFGPFFAAHIRRQRVSRMRGVRHWVLTLIRWAAGISGGRPPGGQASVDARRYVSRSRSIASAP